MGPGRLALHSGDYSLGATDVSERTYRGTLSVGRSFDTLNVNLAGSSATEHFAADQVNAAARAPARVHHHC